TLPKHAPTTAPYTLSLHDALPISPGNARARGFGADPGRGARGNRRRAARERLTLHAPRHEHGGQCRRVAGAAREVVPARGELLRSEEHTSELQSRRDLVCRLLLEK